MSGTKSPRDDSQRTEQEGQWLAWICGSKKEWIKL